MPAHSAPARGGHATARHPADEAEQAIRRLTHITRPATGEPDDPCDAADVIAALAAMTWMLPQLLGQLAHRLNHQHLAGRLRTDAPAPDPDHTVRTLTGDLQHAAQAARAAAEALDAAHQHAARLALTNPAQDPDRRGQDSCTSVGPNHLTRPNPSTVRDVRAEWSPEDVVASWTLVDEDWSLIANKSGVTRLGFAVLLKFFELEALFPASPDEVPAAAVSNVSQQVGVDAAAFVSYTWSGRAIERHRVQIRQSFGFREFTRGDEDKLADWLATEICPVELREELLREALLVRCRTERLEPPGRPERIIGSARTRFEKSFCELVTRRLGAVLRQGSCRISGFGSDHTMGVWLSRE